MYQLMDFQDVVANLGYGKTSRELMSNLNEIIRAVSVNGGKGVLTLRLEVSLNDMNAIIISDKITAKKPEGKRLPIDLEATESGDLFLIDDPDAALPVGAGSASTAKVGGVRFDVHTGEVIGED